MRYSGSQETRKTQPALTQKLITHIKAACLLAKIASGGSVDRGRAAARGCLTGGADQLDFLFIAPGMCARRVAIPPDKEGHPAQSQCSIQCKNRAPAARFPSEPASDEPHEGGSGRECQQATGPPPMETKLLASPREP